MKDKRRKLFRFALAFGGLYIIVGVLIILFGNKLPFFNIFKTEGLGFMLMFIGGGFMIISGLLCLEDKVVCDG